MEAHRLTFDWSKAKYDLWESRLLRHLRSLKLKETILYEPINEEQRADDSRKNAYCYAELIRLIDDKSLSLIKHESAGDGRKALKMLRDHYSRKSKPRIIKLYSCLTKLRMNANEGVTDYLLRAENVISALRDGGETPSDGLIIATIINGLPNYFRPLSDYLTEDESYITFTEFKRRLRLYERTGKMTIDESLEEIIQTESSHSLIMTCMEDTVNRIKTEPTDDLIMTCVEETVNKIKAEPTDGLIMTCVEEAERNMKVESPDIDLCVEQSLTEEPIDDIIEEYVEGRCSSHFTRDGKKFVSYDGKIQPANQYVEHAGGSKSNEQRIPTVIYLLDNAGQQHRAELRETVYIPSYPQNSPSAAKEATRGPLPVPIRKKKSLILDSDGNRKRNSQDDGPYVKKPLNAFMLFLKEQRKSVETEVGIKTSSSINKVLGERWKSLPDKEKEKYFARATWDSHLHAKHHPGWTPKENYGKKRGRVRGRAPNETSPSTAVKLPNPPQAAMQSSTAQSNMFSLPTIPTYDNPILLMGPCFKPL